MTTSYWYCKMRDQEKKSLSKCCYSLFFVVQMKWKQEQSQHEYLPRSLQRVNDWICHTVQMIEKEGKEMRP